MMVPMSTSGIADPALLAARALQQHRRYSTWYGAFGLVNLVMIALVALLGPPWGWVVPIVLAVVALIPLIRFVLAHSEVALAHRGASATFWIGLLLLWAATCPIALSSPNRHWVFWLGGALMAVLGLVTAARIRAAATRQLAQVERPEAVF